MNYKEQRRIQLGKILTIEQCSKDVRDKNRANQRVLDDSKIRLEIQSIIKKEIEKGLSKQEICQILKSDPSYNKYSDFFYGWIEHAMKKFAQGKYENLTGFISDKTEMKELVIKHNREIGHEER